MNNGISSGIKHFSLWAWSLPVASTVTQFTFWQPRLQSTVSKALCAAQRSYSRALRAWLSEPTRCTRPEQLRRLYREAGESQEGRLASSALQLFTKQKDSSVQLFFVSLAVAGVPVAFSLQHFHVTPRSHCQPIDTTAALDNVPAVVWPRLRFYSRVTVRMVVLLSIFSPLAFLYPISCLHPRARTVWLGLLRLSLQWCGPAFTKWAQWASARGDLLPPDVRAVLETLQNAAPAESRADTLRTLQRSLSMPIDEVFAYIDLEPAGSGAIAQVHRAELTPKAAAFCGISPDQVLPSSYCICLVS